MTMKSAFYPLLGDKIFGWMGDTIDIISVATTLFGVCTTLGLGVQQINSGVSRLNPNIPVNTTTQVCATLTELCVCVFFLCAQARLLGVATCLAACRSPHAQRAPKPLDTASHAGRSTVALPCLPVTRCCAAAHSQRCSISHTQRVRADGRHPAQLTAITHAYNAR
jgi:BCCT, betaine/carnitine/choline family transporter